ncbi:hypothetical protein ASPBRDRAFT_39897 [Aspergillus brasiliensis CBS 101740]|uniref:GATA-type domain-containing protein n=1 Tax=Aspergillus brasiliensis (strain CBS 101740 / IMI 381727 / IBT 21946) TaxID=767769 RepID=A0A1L9USV0_ASPBC|nr:hypothetical protein ASPBRDRAFT_39897 [Aspergillus brasiliensis CBS 101740]
MELEFHQGRRVAQNQIPSQAYGLRAPVSNSKPPGPPYSMDARSIPRSMSRGAANLLQLSASATISSSAAVAATTSTTPATTTTTVPAIAPIPTVTTAPAGTNNPQHPTPDIGPVGTNNDGWSARVLDELKDLLLLLSHDGQVLYASPSCSEVTGLESHMLEQSDFSRFIHEDDKPILGHELEECIKTGREIRCHFRLCRPDNSSCLLEAHGHPHLMTAGTAPSVTAESSQRQQQKTVCKGIFLVCRPYPTRGSQLLDSFLEHKIENIRLNQRIAQLKEEEEEEVNSRPGQTSTTTMTSTTTTTTTRQTYVSTTQTSFAQRDTSVSGEENESSDTITTGDDADSRSFLEQVGDRLPQTEDLSHIDGIEVMTGLYYGEGERSQGLSTGVRHGRLIRCNTEQPNAGAAGSAVTAPPGDQQQQQQLQQQQQPPQSHTQPQSKNPTEVMDRKKRMKGEYMCTDCGTSDSPEWRKGPEGPKTLCNACGLRWAKKEKKRQDSGS